MQKYLINFQKSYLIYQRLKGNFLIYDIWKQSAEIVRHYFVDAKIIIGKYHFIRQVTWYVENVRKI